MNTETKLHRAPNKATLVQLCSSEMGCFHSNQYRSVNTHMRKARRNSRLAKTVRQEAQLLIALAGNINDLQQLHRIRGRMIFG